jgi:hypothetical protein
VLRLFYRRDEVVLVLKAQRADGIGDPHWRLTHRTRPLLTFEPVSVESVSVSQEN